MKMNPLSDLTRRIRRGMVEQDIRTVRELERKAGVPKDTVRHVLSGRTRSVRQDKLPGIARALGFTVDELMGVKPEPAGGRNVTRIAVAPSNEPQREIGALSIDDEAFDALVAGAVVGLPVMLVYQHSNMEPTIRKGDVILCDAERQKLGGDGLYVLRGRSGSLTVRRIHVSDLSGSVSILNDNKNVPTEESAGADSINIAASVLGVFRRL